MNNNINITNKDIIKACSFCKIDAISREIKNQIKYKLYDDDLILL